MHSRFCLPAVTRKRCRPLYPSSLARVARTGPRSQPRRRCSSSQSFASPSCYAATCCAASPLGPCANDRKDRTLRIKMAALAPSRPLRSRGDGADRPWSPDAHAAAVFEPVQLFLRHDPGRDTGVCDRQSFSGLAAMAEIKVETVAKTFGTFAAVKGVTFTVDHGSFFVILGPSGCGRPRTLHVTAPLDLRTSDRIMLDGDDVTALRAAARDLAFVFHLFAL